MYFRKKVSQGRVYLQIAESRREGKRVRQRVICTLGRLEALQDSGQIERLVRSGARFAEQAAVLSAAERDGVRRAGTWRIGPALAFERLWAETGCRQVIEQLAAGRRFGFALERAVFLTVLHRIFAGGSDRHAERWREAYRIAGSEALDLHHLYRAMAWLGEELADEADAEALAPRTTKDLIEEDLFARRRDLFSTLDVVFMDTTSLYFEGAGGAALGRRGYSKDHRPDLKQMILAVVLDQDGRPICCEMWPGNTADVRGLIPVVDRLKQRFAIGRLCVVADRGMISAATIAGLEERGLDYILGARERSDKLVREVVLADETPFVPLALSRRGKTVEYGAKQVKLEGLRYIVCRNHDQARRDGAERAAIIEGLERQLKKGDKALVGNAGYRRYLKTTGEARFAIDEEKVARDAKFDGTFEAAVDRRAPVPRRQAPPGHPAGLPQVRPHHPRPRVLLLPRPRAQGRARDAHRRPGRDGLLGRDHRRSRCPRRDRDRTGRQTLRDPQPAQTRRQPRAPRRRGRPAAHHPSNRRKLTPHKPWKCSAKPNLRPGKLC
jgi:hypothetical protein